jgi:hypothetical protein
MTSFITIRVVGCLTSRSPKEPFGQADELIVGGCKVFDFAASGVAPLLPGLHFSPVKRRADPDPEPDSGDSGV